jgi:hypothetical protein
MKTCHVKFVAYTHVHLANKTCHIKTYHRKLARLSVLHWANFFARRKAKNKSWQCDWSAKKFAAKKLDQFLLFYCSREQIRVVDNGLN